MSDFFTNLSGIDTHNLVEVIDEAINKNVTSDEENKALKNELAKALLQFQMETAEVGLAETGARLKSIDSTRGRVNLKKIQETENIGWVTRNIHSILGVKKKQSGGCGKVGFPRRRRPTGQWCVRTRMLAWSWVTSASLVSLRHPV